MPIIKTPSVSPVNLQGRIGQGAAVAPALAAAASGEGTAVTGRSISQSGLNQAREGLNVIRQVGNEVAQLNRSVQLAQYSNKVNQAKLDFAKRLDERMTQTVDAKGNPTFDALTDDVGAIGNEVKQQTLSTIPDAALQAQFSQTFDSDIVNKQINSLSVARNQKHDFIRTSLSDGVNSLIAQAGTDDSSNTKFYTNEIQKITRGAEESGALTAKQGADLRQESTQQIVSNQYNDLMLTAPDQALLIIEGTSAEALGITESTRNKMLDKATAAVDDANTKAELAKIDTANAAKEQSNIIESQLRLGMEDGTSGSKDIVQAQQDGILNEDQFNNLQQIKAKKDREKFFNSKVNLEISSKLSSGSPVLHFTPTQVGKHFQQRVALMEQQGEQTTLKQKAGIAIQYGTRVKPLEKELEFSLLKTEPNAQSADTLQTIQFLNKESPATIQNLDKDAQAVAALANNYLDNTSLSIEDAINRAKGQITTLDTEKGQQNAKDFNNLDDFNDDIDSTIVNMHNGWLGKQVDPEAKAALKDLYRDAYIKTGDVEGSVDLVKAQTAALFGESEFNEEKGIFNDKETLMFMPPEKFFPGISSDMLKQNLHNSVEPILPEGVASEDVQIQADSMSRLAGRPISYGLFYRDKFGQQQFVTDENGIAQRWVPDPHIEQEAQRAEQVVELTAESKRQGELAQQLIPKEILEADGNKVDLRKDLADVVAAGGDKSTSFFKLAKSFGGFQDRNSRRVLADFFQSSIGSNIDEVKTAWSGAFVNKVIQTKDPESLQEFGTPTTTPKQGDVTILDKIAGFFAGKAKDGKIKVLSKIGKKLHISSHNAQDIIEFRKAPDASEIKIKLSKGKK